MPSKVVCVGLLCLTMASAPYTALAGDLKLTIPGRSKLTPVQRLNRDGVEAVKKHAYSKAEQFFYKAYLLDPEDPFTLNNLGYISEIQGQVDRAQRFYELAAQNASEAVVDRASAKSAQGLPMKSALAVSEEPLHMNHANVEAVRLLSQGRAPEADLLLQQAAKSDPRNVFTLNNLGVAKQMEGEDQEALKYYDAATAVRSDASTVVTIDRQSRGRPVSQVAAENAKALRARMQRVHDIPEQVAELNLRGVSAVNRNDLRSADEDFRRAYALDPNSAFTLNNIGYVAELEGDRETAEFFYDRAEKAGVGRLTVGIATRRSAEGMRLSAVAADSNNRVEARVKEEREILQRENQPVVLRRRDNSVVEEPPQPVSANPNPSPQ
jgi:Flp pilus assembly protein TadD